MNSSKDLRLTDLVLRVPLGVISIAFGWIGVAAAIRILFSDWIPQVQLIADVYAQLLGIEPNASSMTGNRGLAADLTKAILFFAGPMISAGIGGAFLKYGKRSIASVGNHAPDLSREKVVVYLRSFDSDTRMARVSLSPFRFTSVKSEEEQLAEALKEYGRVVAIGRPGESLPILGASRVYIANEHWRNELVNWLQRASLVVINLPPDKLSESVVWEIQTCARLVDPEKLVMLVPKSKEALPWIDQFKGLERYKGSIQAGSSPYGSRIAGVMARANDAITYFPLQQQSILHRHFSSPLVLVYKSAIRGLLDQNDKSARLPFAFGELFMKVFLYSYMAITLLLPLFIVLLALGRAN